MAGSNTDFGLIDIAKSKEKETSSQRKVDRLGRVRPNNYVLTTLKGESEKKKCRTTHSSSSNTIHDKPKEQDKQFFNESRQPIEDISVLQKETEIEDIPENNQTFNNDVEISDDTTPGANAPREHFLEIIKQMVEDSCSNLVESNNDDERESGVISTENWETLINFDSNEDVFEDSNNPDTNFTKETKMDTDMPIYPGHPMTINTSMMLILLYTVCHTTSGAQLSDMLTLISLHCLHPHPGLASLHMFNKYFANIESPLKKHFYCKSCMSDINGNDEICSNDNCKTSLKDPKSKDYFIEIPIEKQLLNILKRCNTLSLIKERFSRKKQNNNGIEDIYDGNVYQKLSAPGGPLSQDFPYNVSFTWNTDGIPVFKSSKFSLWPFYLVINELPYKQRMLKENMILCGLWFGETKPFISLFSKPIMKSLKKMEDIGVEYEVGSVKYNTKAYLICGTADLPAKSLVLNCNQFNGENSCMRCLHPGETFKTAKGGCVRIFPYDASKPQFETRTFDQTIQDAISAIENRKVTRGIKGPSFLMTVKSYDFVRSNSIDYMHGVLLGITKLLIKLWISSGNSKENFSISQYVDIIDQRLIQLKPPAFITRVPRTLSDHFKYWKASELRSWLFYYSLPILHDILPDAYFIHYGSFVQAIFLLCTDCVLPDDIEKSRKFLSYFVHMFPALYGDRYLTLNMHSLLHLPDCVEDLGPLWVYSCFPFENVNGTLMELFHGTQNVELQILSSVNVFQNMPDMVKTIKDPVYVKFVDKLRHKPTHHKISFSSSSGSSPIGRSSDINVTKSIHGKLVSEVGFLPKKLFPYKRISHRGAVIHSEEYSRVQQRDTFSVKYYDCNGQKNCYGKILYFIHAKTCECSTSNLCRCDSALTAVVSEYQQVKPSILKENFLGIEATHIKVTKLTGETSVIDVKKILSVVVNVKFESTDGINYLCDVPNLMESD